MPFDASFTEKTKVLFEQLKKVGAEITFEINEEQPCWYLKEKLCFTIGAHENVPNQPAMAHELLHVNLTLKGFRSNLLVYTYYNENNSIFNADFIADLNNNIAHFKMLDEFLEMGFHVDDFLQDTPKTYFLEGMLFKTVALMAHHNAGIANVCEQTREIIRLCSGAKLFELYKIKFPETTNGLHPDAVMEQLKDINMELVEGLNTLFNDWNKANTVDNLQFFYRLDALLKQLNIPNAVDCT